MYKTSGDIRVAQLGNADPKQVAEIIADLERRAAGGVINAPAKLDRSGLAAFKNQLAKNSKIGRGK